MAQDRRGYILGYAQDTGLKMVGSTAWAQWQGALEGACQSRSRLTEGSTRVTVMAVASSMREKRAESKTYCIQCV